MGKKTINNGDAGLSVRAALNDNFTELYDSVEELEESGLSGIPIWQLSNIFPALQRIPAFFKRPNAVSPNSSVLDRRFVLGMTADTHGYFDGLGRFGTFINLIKEEDRNVPPVTTFKMVQGMVMCGDIINGVSTKEVAQAEYAGLEPYFTSYGVDLLAGFGDHDQNAINGDNLASIILSKQEQYEAMIEPMINNTSDVVTGGGNSCYWYKDYDGGDEFKVRVIMLDQYDMPQDLVDGEYKYPIKDAVNYSSAQLTWLAETALDLPSADWHIVIFSGENINKATTHNSSHTVVHDLIDAYAEQGIVDMDDATEDFEYDIDVDYSTINGFDGSVIGFFHGGPHMPLIQTITINTREYNNIALPSGYYSGAGYDTAWSRQENTGCEDSFTFLVVDTEDKTIYLLRYGNPCDVYGEGLPFGDFGIDTPITY